MRKTGKQRTLPNFDPHTSNCPQCSNAEWTPATDIRSIFAVSQISQAHWRKRSKEAALRGDDRERRFGCSASRASYSLPYLTLADIKCRQCPGKPSRPSLSLDAYCDLSISSCFCRIGLSSWDLSRMKTFARRCHSHRATLLRGCLQQLWSGSGPREHLPEHFSD